MQLLGSLTPKLLQAVNNLGLKDCEGKLTTNRVGEGGHLDGHASAWKRICCQVTQRKIEIAPAEILKLLSEESWKLV